MYIKHIEVGNFRKLKAVRVDFAPQKTVFVGANNSGKTSAMVALRTFLLDPTAFSITDFTISNWKSLNDSAESWEQCVAQGSPVPKLDWSDYLPFVDVWLHVELAELHYVRKLLATLDWAGGIMGVRLRYEPEHPEELQREYLEARAQVALLLAAPTTPVTIELDSQTAGSIPTAIEITAGTPELPVKEAKVELKVSLWPQSMSDFLERRLKGKFKIKGYILDPAKLVDPTDGTARPQSLSEDDEPIEGSPFAGLIEIDEISAQRGFGQPGQARRGKEDDGKPDRQMSSEGKRLSKQLRSYYTNHLDPYDTPEPQDLGALHALEAASGAFDARLKACFANALEELEGLGYPGINDPKLTISTRLTPTDGLNHDSAVQYEVPTFAAANASAYRLPEGSNGLGYQNLVSMVFALMSFRDAWMRVGKAGNSAKATNAHIPPLHLILIEEPEAHLHAQVQQVFIKQAYSVLRNHKNLKESLTLRTQLVVSTHSSHVAHACDFASLRYFRRMPAPAEAGAVPTASVINLSEVFGGADLTEKFVTRYLKASHCDLFFADGVVLVEGPAERLLVPHFVEERPEFDYLRRCYITWLEIGGSHAHRLRQLIEHLGVSTLIITDLDAKAKDSNAAVPPFRGAGQRARNETLKTWVPATESLDELLDKSDAEKALLHPSGYGVRVAYQVPVNAIFKSAASVECLANTFEDAIVYENLSFFTGRNGNGLTAKITNGIAGCTDLKSLAEFLHEALKTGGKAEFALDLLYSDDIQTLTVPKYIRDGLVWLIDQLKRKEKDLAAPAIVAAAA